MIQVPDEIKELLHLDTCKKNIRIHFPNGERSDICNDFIVKDSVSFKESLCSQETLKFGLCEASVFEVETVGVGNIKGATIEVSCEVYCDSSVSGAVWQMDLQAWVYAIPYGTFIVDTAKRQADMIHRRIVAYTEVAVNDWEITGCEQKKGEIIFSSDTAYTPNIIYFLEANRLFFEDDIYDITPPIMMNNSYESTTVEEMIGDALKPNYSISIVEYYEYYTFGMAYDTDYQCIFEINGDFVDNTETFREIAYGEWLDEDKSVEIFNLLMSMPESSARYPYANFGREISEDKRMNPFVFYPYFNGYYTSNSKIFEIHVPLYASFEISNNGTVIYQKDVVWLDNPICRKKKLKSTYSNFALSYARKESDDAVDGYIVDFSTGDDTQALLNAWLELNGLFGYYVRTNTIRLMDIKQQFGLLPNTDLYPNTNLYPQGVTGGKLLPNDYQSCWYDDDYTMPYGCIYCQYKNNNNKDKIMKYFLTGYNSSTPLNIYRTYDISNNEIIKNYKWTKAQIRAICEAIADNISGVTYMPVEFVGRGLPYVEAGDTFEILTKSNDSITTIVLNRTITGELTLTDNYKSV